MISAVDGGGEQAGIGTHQAPGPRVVCEWQLRGLGLDLTSPAVMGILNLTPDSFSDGGELGSLGRALQRARALMAEGARILDVGGESTRPGARAVPVQEEKDRILPFIRRAVEEGLGPISVDTRNAEVAREALRSGARIVNDVSGLMHDPEMARVVAEEGAGVVLSHMRGTPATMRELAEYGDVVAEVMDELGASLALALEAGIPRERIVVDPGFGFAKTRAHTLTLLRDLASLGSLGYPILVGPSRKSFLGEVTGLPPAERLPGTLAACVVAFSRGAKVFRVHDVAPTVQALRVAEAILNGGEGSASARVEGSGALLDRTSRS